MKIEYRIAQLQDLDFIYEFAESKLKNEIPDDMERMMKVWESRFRKEALEHYLKLGWSFVAEYTDSAIDIKNSSENKKSKILGFFLGQPLLFFQGQTQTLWVEEIQATTLDIAAELVDISYKLSKDKHFQKVILPIKTESILNSKNIKYQKQTEAPQNEWLWCKTTK